MNKQDLIETAQAIVSHLDVFNISTLEAIREDLVDTYDSWIRECEPDNTEFDNLIQQITDMINRG